MGKRNRKASDKRRREQKCRSTALSLCLIAKDEAEFLARCLGSAKDLVDEIVVVDTGSSDDTVAVATRYGARVVTTTWNDDFSAARNRALELANGEWILSLDCDEYLAARDHPIISNLLRADRADGYRLTTRNYSNEQNQAGWTACDGRYAEEKRYPGWFPTSKVRLWRNKPHYRFEGAVHELVETSILKHDGEIADCTVPIHHYGHVEKQRARDRYLEAGQRKVKEDPTDLQARYELAIALRNAGRCDEGLEQIAYVLPHLGTGCTEHPYLERELALLVNADLLSRLGRSAEAEEAYRRIIEVCPQSYQAYNNLGLIYECQGAITEAEKCYFCGLQVAPDNPVLVENKARVEGLTSTGGARRLSVCLIARNEEEVLSRCLESVAPIADEIVVVDTGSTDNTIAIASEFGAKIDKMAWRDDFSAARNRSLEMASGEWILWMDADDYLLVDEQNKVQRAKSLDPNQGLYFTLMNEGNDCTSFRQVKMFPNHPEIRFDRSVHESVVPALERLGFPIRVTDVKVRHTGYAEPEVTRRKQRYYLELMENWLSNNPDDQYIRFRVGHTYYSQGDRARAQRYFRKIIAAGKDQAGLMASFRSSLVFQGRCLLEEGDHFSAIPLFEQALAYDRTDSLINMSLGDACTKMKLYDKAISYLRAAVSGTGDPHFPIDEKVVQYSSNFFLGQCLEATGNPVEAREAFLAATEADPERSEARQALMAIRESASEADMQQPASTKCLVAENAESRISLCMIVRDEEERLPTCLDHVAELVDEIVLVDTGSSDDTLEIAKKYGAKVGFFEWCDDFAAARNESIRLATGDWILWLDADDILPIEYHDQIRQLVQQPCDRSFLFVLDDRGYEHISCLQMRLFPNLNGVRFEMPIHEQVTLSLARLGIEMVPTEIKVRHTGYTTPEVVKQKKDRYLGVMERWLDKHPEDYITRSHVALTYYSDGRMDDAIAAYSKIVHDSTCLSDRNYVVYTTALLFLGRSLMKSGDYERALENMRKAHEVDPDYLLTKVSLAELHIARGEYEDALGLANEIVASESQLTFFPVAPAEISFSAVYLSAQAHHALGHMVEAERAYRQAAEQPVPRRTEALGNLAMLLKELGRREESLGILLEANEMDPVNCKHEFNIGVHYLEQQDLEEARRRFERVVEEKADFRPAWLNLGYIAKATGRFGEAEGIYADLVATVPEEVEARANLGHLYLDQERFADAKSMFEELRRHNANLLDINLGLMLAVAHLEDWVAVRRLADELRDLFIGTVDLGDSSTDGSQIASGLVRLGSHLTSQGQHKCAEFCYAAAALVDNSNMKARRCLGEIHWLQGAVWKAVTQYEALLLANPRDGQAFQRLGDCYQKLGVQDAAAMCYAKSTEISQG